MEKRNRDVKWLWLEGCAITDVSALEQVAGPKQDLVSDVVLGLIIVTFINPLDLQLRTKCTLKNTLHVSGHLFLCLFLGNDFSGCFLSITPHVD